MSLTNSEILELDALCHALVDGVITDSQKDRLSRWLSASEEARRYYVRAMALSASLCEYAGEMQSEAPDAPATPTVIRPARWHWIAASLAAAAAVVLAFWLGNARQAEQGGSAIAEQEADESVARISAAKDAKWEGTAHAPGDDLRRGQRIDLFAGVAEITFDCGAQVMLEGPASLDVISAWEAALRAGTLRAKIPPEAIGFRIANPQVDVVDLGTEFSMVADRSGHTEVYVLQGAVEAAARENGSPGTPIVLREKQARRFAKSGITEVPDRDQKLARFLRKVAMDRVNRPVNLLRWSFDEAGGAIARANGPAGNSSGNDATIVGSVPGAAAGKFGGALVFDGSHLAHAAVPGLSERTGRTIAFWVKSRADAGFPDSGAMLSWAVAGRELRPLEIGWNRNPNHGPIGGLRTQVGRGIRVGSIPVNDGSWRHIAIVFSQKAKADAVPAIKLYVDGRLDPGAGRHGGKHGGEARDARMLAARMDTLWIGQSVSAGENPERFRGALDELVIADRTLTQQEIRHLMEFNSPGTSETLAGL